MKKILGVVICLSFFLMVLGVGHLAAATIVGMDFTSSTSVLNGKNVVTFEPWTPGIRGDGFIVNYQNKEYFLPEDKRLVLPTDKYYQLVVSRAYRTGRGIVSGDGQTMSLNAQADEIWGDTLPLSPAQVYGWMSSVRVIPNFSQGNFYIDPDAYMLPPAKFDDIEVEFGGSSQSGVEPKIFRIQEAGSVEIPASNYAYCRAVARVIDKAHGRIIEGSAGFVSFTR